MISRGVFVACRRTRTCSRGCAPCRARPGARARRPSARAPGAIPRQASGWGPRQIHDGRQELSTCDAVHQGMVRLADHRPAGVLQPLHHPDLPQRFAAVELLRHEAPHQPAELELAARCRQRRASHVVLEVEVWIVHPRRAAEVVGDSLHNLAVPGHQVQLAGDRLDHPVVRRRRALEDADRADVHVAGGVLDREEGCVERAQAVCHPPRLPPPP